MTWIDIVLLIILISLVIQGLVTGLVRSVFDIVGIIAGYILAINFSDTIKIPGFLAFLLIFVITVIAVSLLGRLLSKLVRATPLGFVDRLLGSVLGLVKGFICCFIFLLVILLLKKSDDIIKESQIAPAVLKGGVYASQVLPRKWYDWVKKTVTKRELVAGKEVGFLDP